MNNKKPVFLSLETAKEMYNNPNDSLRKFALENFTKEELEAKELPKSFKELKLLHGYFIDGASQILLHTGNHSHLFHKNVFPTKELAEASLALSQLLQLRDIYNGDWKVDLNNEGEITRHSIYNRYNQISKTSYSGGTNACLSFKSEDLRDQFVENFKDLITTALPLL